MRDRAKIGEDCIAHAHHLHNTAMRAGHYNAAFPNRPPLVYGNGMVVGTWMIGACYKNPNPLYGAYPHGYLERVHSMFPDAREVLHAFSGGLTLDAAHYAAAVGEASVAEGLPLEATGPHRLAARLVGACPSQPGVQSCAGQSNPRSS